MKMISPIHYIKANNLNSVLEFLGSNNSNSQILAGGTDLLIGLRKSFKTAEKTLIDVNFVSELKQIEETDSKIEIGAAVTHTQIIKSSIVADWFPLLIEAVSSIGSVQIRNRGTIGGNICNASPCADSTPALLVLDAELEIKSNKSNKVIKLTDFFTSPYKTILKKDEIVTKFILPKKTEKYGYAFLKSGRRNAMSIARMNIAASLNLDDNNQISFCRIAAGSIFPTTARVEKAEQLLLGENPSENLFSEAGNMVAKEMILVTGRRWSTEYKEPVIRILVKRALVQSWNQINRDN